MSASWQLRCLPEISSEFQASQAAALRKKTRRSAKDFWCRLIGCKVSLESHADKLLAPAAGVCRKLPLSGAQSKQSKGNAAPDP
jgi:hypothetical protein